MSLLREQFERDGYCVFTSVIPDDDLAMLRDECDQAVADLDAAMDRDGVDVLDISVRGSRYFVTNRSTSSPRMLEFVVGPVIGTICQELVGPSAYLIHEQFVVKLAEVGMEFAWHQDSGYVQSGFVDYANQDFITCWCALDDMTAANGTVSVLPFGRAPSRDLRSFTVDASTNDQVAYDGDDPGELLEVPAGSIVAFSSFLLHRSGANTTSQPRRVLTASYSREPFTFASGDVAGRAELVAAG